jgi:hypothetical protein
MPLGQTRAARIKHPNPMTQLVFHRYFSDVAI